MERLTVISLSVGTCLLLLLSTALLSTAIVIGGHASNPAHVAPSTPIPFAPKTGAMGELQRLQNELQYGPVNLDAANGVKNGLFDRIRANRQSRVCPAPSPQACSTQVTTAYRVVDPSDCTYVQTVDNAASVAAPLVIQSTGVRQPAVEMPSVIPLATLMLVPPMAPNCPTCKPDPRAEVKTGSFLCSNCRKSQVGEWHTDWTSSGQPITFLCESCHSFMSPQQRETAYRGYLARQTKSVGNLGLLHQELGK